MKDTRTDYSGDVELKKIGNVSDTFTLNNSKGNTSIVNINIKPRIISYYVGKDDCGVSLNIYGILVTEITYFSERDYKKYTQNFATSFTQAIYLPDNRAKILSVSVNLENKHFKKLNDCNVLGFFTLLFSIKLNLSTCIDNHNICCDHEIKDFDYCNTFKIDSYLSDIPSIIDTEIIDSNLSFRPIDNVSPIDFNNQVTPIKNTLLKYINSFQQQNRL